MLCLHKEEQHPFFRYLVKWFSAMWAKGTEALVQIPAAVSATVKDHMKNSGDAQYSNADTKEHLTCAVNADTYEDYPESKQKEKYCKNDYTRQFHK